MKLKLFKKLFITTACVLFVTLTLVFVLMSVFVNDEFARTKYEVLDKSCVAVAESFKENYNNFNESTYSLIDTVANLNELDIYIADNHGRIRVCSCDAFSDNKNCIHSNTILSREFLDGISQDTKLELSSIDGIYDRLCYTSSKRISLGSDEHFYVISVSKVLTATDIMKTIFGMYAISAIIPILFMFVAEYSLMYRLTRPLKYMSISAKAIAQGDFTKRVPVMSNDEIGELSVLFNQMSASLSRTETTSKSFIANVSHELKTPMTTISGFIDGIIDGTIDDSKRDYYLKIVSEEIKRLSRLVQSMLSLAKLEAGDNVIKTTEFQLSNNVISIVVSMQQKIEEKELEIYGLETLSETKIMADADLLYQVAYNLIDNAVKFTDKQGAIHFSLLRINNNIEFKIKNTGTGINKQDLPHIFEKFYKSDKSRSNVKDSLGLGLYICKTIVDLHGGTISVASEDDEFTEFTVILPINFAERS